MKTFERDDVTLKVAAHFVLGSGQKVVDQLVAVDIRPRDRAAEGSAMLKELSDRYGGASESEWDRATLQAVAE